jgi:2-hydroxychromene-2-carboxylate isomerase
VDCSWSAAISCATTTATTRRAGREKHPHESAADRFLLRFLVALRLFRRDPDRRAGGEARPQALFHAYFAEDRDISNPEVTGNVAAKLGIDKAELAQALNDPAVKERLRNEVDAAIERGVFGSPYIVVDGEPFWGSDRLDQVEQWLTKPW